MLDVISKISGIIKGYVTLLWSNDNSTLKLKEELKIDLEILSNFEKESERYCKINSHIDEKICLLYPTKEELLEREKGENEEVKEDMGCLFLIIILLILIIFPIWSIYLLTQKSLWVFATIAVSIVALGVGHKYYNI
jgi:hypothetical protein